MTTYQEKAEKYVREKLPELMELSFGCWIENMYGAQTVVTSAMNGNATTTWFANCNKDDLAGSGYKIIGHPIQLQHWLKAIPTYIPYFIETVEASDITTIRLSRRDGQDRPVWFNLTTGQPASEKDYQMFYTLVGVE